MAAETTRTRLDDELDRMLEDSFPASDPPSFTPVTGVGEAAPRPFSPPPAEPEAASHWRRLALAGLAGAASIAAIVAVFAIRRARSRSNRKRMRIVVRGVRRAGPVVQRGAGAVRAVRAMRAA